jgi:hypothetical protein
MTSLDRFLFTRSTSTESERRALARRVSQGALVRVTRGAYLEAAVARTRDRDEVHRDLVQARSRLSNERLVFGGASAAAMWRLPRLSAWPAIPEVVDRHAAGGRSPTALHRRSTGRVEIDVVDGVMVTSLLETVLALARFELFSDALTATDAALRGFEVNGRKVGVESGMLAARLRDLARHRGVARARAVLDFADAGAESPGESLSRIQMDRLGVVPPTLQQEFRDDLGLMRVDFWWPVHRVVGEFDGLTKYLRDPHGRSPQEVVIQEKLREDRLRALGLRVIRWTWTEARNAEALRRHLAPAGLV